MSTATETIDSPSISSKEPTEPSTPPPSLSSSKFHSFLSFSPSPTPPRRTQPLPSKLSLEPPPRFRIQQIVSPTLVSPPSSEFNLDNFDEEDGDLSPTMLSIVSPTMITIEGGGGFSSRNPFLAILLAQQQQQQQQEEVRNSLSSSRGTSSGSSTLSKGSTQEEEEEEAGSLATTSSISSIDSSGSRGGKKDLEKENRIGFSEEAGSEGFSELLQDLNLDSEGNCSQDREGEIDEEEELSFNHPFASVVQGPDPMKPESEEPPSTPVTPILSFTPSSPDQTPRAKPSSSPSKRRSVSSPRSSRRQSIITASSPRRYRVSPRRSSTATTVSTTKNSRRSSIAPPTSSLLVQGFKYYPTSPLHSLQHSPTILSSSSSYQTLSVSPPKKKKKKPSKSSSSRSKTRVPDSRPVQTFDSEALDLFFGVTRSVSKARKGGYESIAREAGILNGKGGIGEEEREREREQWRKVEELRGLLDQRVDNESEEELEEEDDEEVLHIKSSPVPTSQLFLTLPCSTRSTTHRSRRRSTPRSLKKKKSRPPPLQLSHSNDSFTSSASSTTSLSFDVSGGESSSFSPDTPRSPRLGSSSSTRGSLDSPISLETSNASSPIDPISKETFRRQEQDVTTNEESVVAGTTRAEVGVRRDKSLKKTKSVGDRLRNLCRF